MDTHAGEAGRGEVVADGGTVPPLRAQLVVFFLQSLGRAPMDTLKARNGSSYATLCNDRP